MKRITLLFLLSAAVGAAVVAYPADAERYAGAASAAAGRAWVGVEANPVPFALAVGTFLLTVVYYKAKGKSLRESVAVAATRVTVVPVPMHGGDENPAVARAQARAARAQLIADQIGLQNRRRKLPDEVNKAEKDACYTEQAVADAERLTAEKAKAHDAAAAKLDALRKELAACDAELAEIEAGLKKLADRV